MQPIPGAGLYSRPMGPNPMRGSEPLDREALVGSRRAGSGLPHFGYVPPAGLVMHDTEGNPITDRPELSGLAGNQGAALKVPPYPGQRRPHRGEASMPAYPGFPTPNFTWNLYPA